MLPNPVQDAIARYFERLRQFVEENQDILPPMSRIKPLDVGFMDKSCDTLVATTMMHETNGATTRSSVVSTTTTNNAPPPSDSATVPMILEHDGGVTTTTTATTTTTTTIERTLIGFESEHHRKRFNWLDFVSIMVPDEFDEEQQAHAIHALFFDRSLTRMHYSAEHPHHPVPAAQTCARIETEAGRSLCIAFVEVIFAIARHRRAQGWPTTLLILSKAARRAILHGLQHLPLAPVCYDAPQLE